MDNNNRNRLSKYTDNLIEVCNKILVEREDKCQCFNKKNYPSRHIKKCMLEKNTRKCQNYNKCKKLFASFTSLRFARSFILRFNLSAILLAETPPQGNVC